MDSNSRKLRALHELEACDCAECMDYAHCITIDVTEGLDYAAAYMELLLVEHQEQCIYHRYQPHN